MSNFSFSRINLFEKCPKAYHFKYILKKDEHFSTIEQHLGKCIHTAIEYAYQIRDEGYNVSINSFIDTFTKSWSQTSINNFRIVKSSMSADAYYSEGINMLRNFFNNTLANDKSKTIALEKYFEIGISPSISYVGYIDRISIESNDFVRVTDYKTGKRINEPAQDKQLCSYAVWALDKFQLEKIEVVFEALRYGKIYSARINRNQIPLVKKNLLKDINVIIATNSFITRPSILCSWCGYNPICNDFGTNKCPLCGSKLEERVGRYPFQKLP